MPLLDYRIWVPIWAYLVWSPWIEWQSHFMPPSDRRASAPPAEPDEMSVSPALKRAA